VFGGLVLPIVVLKPRGLFSFPLMIIWEISFFCVVGWSYAQ
jgi:hypothetical protein